MSAKPFIIFLLGAAVGGAAGYIIGTRRQIKKNDREIEELTKYYDNKYKDAVTHSDILRQKAQQEKPKKTEDKPAEGALKLQAEKFTTFDRVAPVKAPIEDYAKKYKMTREEDDGPVLEGDPHGLDSEEEQLVMHEMEHMVIISPDEYDTELDYGKNEVTYWSEEEFFTEFPSGQRIPLEVLSPDDVGRGNLEYNFGISGEEGVLYVRDERNNEDFKIYLEETNYEGPTD